MSEEEAKRLRIYLDAVNEATMSMREYTYWLPLAMRRKVAQACMEVADREFLERAEK